MGGRIGMHTLPFEILFSELKKDLEEIYGVKLRGIYLFGSFARGEAQEGSDVDILIVLDHIENYLEELGRTGNLVSTLSLKYGVTVSRVFVSEEDWQKVENPFFTNLREEAHAL